MTSGFQRVARAALAFTLLTTSALAIADDTSDTVALFKDSHQSSYYFRNSYGYAIFPTIGEGGFVVAGAHGTGEVFVHGRHVGNTSMTEVSVGPQIGGQAYSMVIFFRNAAAFRNFKSGNFEFAADASAVVITSAATASVGTKPSNFTASGGQNNAATRGGYRHGVAVFTIVKGGAMAQANIAGQKYSYTPL